MNWVDSLTEEYEQGRRGLNHMKNELGDSMEDMQDTKYLNSMTDSMTYCIDWMNTGRQPDLYRGVDRKDAYRHKQYDDMDVIPDINEQLRKEREPLYMSNDQRRALLRLFHTFSDRERQCFIMYEAEQMSMGKIADHLGISKGTVQMYIKRARDKVQEVAC